MPRPNPVPMDQMVLSQRTRRARWSNGVKARLAIALLVCSGGFTAACAKFGAEQLLLERFFAASRLRDRTALQQISTVMLEPLEQGTVASFAILEAFDLETAGPVRTRQVTALAPLRLRDGRTEKRKIIFVLQRGDRWMVTGFTIAPP
jgi:hypothetical protein